MVEPENRPRMIAMTDEFDSFVEDVLREPEASSPEPKSTNASMQRRVPAITAPVLVQPGVRMVETGPALRAFRAYGTSLIADLQVAVKDLTGGRSSRIEKILRELHDGAVQELTRDAAARGYDAVVSLRVDYGEIAKSVVYVVATGTPVKLAESRT